MAESTQHKLDKIRPPRVQITYDVEIGDAIVKKELPFVVGIMADLSGRTEEEKAAAAANPLNKRAFVEIDRDNFNDIMASIGPKVKNNGGVIAFTSIEDFDPARIIEKDAKLTVLFERRQRLSDLTARLDGDPELVEELRKLLKDEASVKKLEPLKTKPVDSGTEGGDDNA